MLVVQWWFGCCCGSDLEVVCEGSDSYDSILLKPFSFQLKVL